MSRKEECQNEINTIREKQQNLCNQLNTLKVDNEAEYQSLLKSLRKNWYFNRFTNFIDDKHGVSEWDLRNYYKYLTLYIDD